LKKTWCLSIILIIILLVVGCSNVSKVDMQKLTDDNTRLIGENNDLQANVKKLTDENIDLKEKNQNLQNEISTANKRIEDFSTLEEKYKALSNSEIDAQLAANELQAEKDRQQKEKLLAEERAKAEAEAAKKAAAEEAEANKGYETGITYNQLARTPDDYEGKKVKFTGKVVQMMDGGAEINLRVAVNSDYDLILFVYYPSSLTKTRVLENDIITLYGVSEGLYTYKSTMGGNITIPLIKVEKIEIK